MSDLKEMLATIEEHAVDDHIGRHGWGVVAKKLLKWLRYFMARSRLWKRKATIYRSKYIQADELSAHYMGWWKEAESTATQRLKLLRRCQEIFLLLPGTIFDQIPEDFFDDLTKELADE